MLFIYIFMFFSMALGLFYYEQPYQNPYGEDANAQAKVIAQNIAGVASSVEQSIYNPDNGTASTVTISAGNIQQQPSWIKASMDPSTNIIAPIHVQINNTNNSTQYSVYILPKDLPSTQQGSVYNVAQWIGQMTQYTPNAGVQQSGYLVQTAKPTVILNQENINDKYSLPASTANSTIPNGAVGISRTLTRASTNTTPTP